MTTRAGTTDLIPVVESGIFDATNEHRFAVGMVAVDGVVATGLEGEFAGAAPYTYLALGFVSEADLDERGTELDSDDTRSTQFVIAERTAQLGTARIVGTMRLIVRGADPLPVERFFPDLFSRIDVPHAAVEVSRLIVRHEDPALQTALKWHLFTAGLAHVEQRRLGPVYGLLSPVLRRSLSMQGVPVRTLAPAREIPEIHTRKLPVEIDVTALRSRLAATSTSNTYEEIPAFVQIDILIGTAVVGEVAS